MCMLTYVWELRDVTRDCGRPRIWGGGGSQVKVFGDYRIAISSSSWPHLSLFHKVIIMDEVRGCLVRTSIASNSRLEGSDASRPRILMWSTGVKSGSTVADITSRCSLR